MGEYYDKDKFTGSRPGGPAGGPMPPPPLSMFPSPVAKAVEGEKHSISARAQRMVKNRFILYHAPSCYLVGRTGKSFSLPSQMFSLLPAEMKNRHKKSDGFISTVRRWRRFHIQL